MDSGVIRPLVKQLDDRFTYTPNTQSQFEWRHAEDHIRLVPSAADDNDNTSHVVLEMIDGRLEDKLPSLFEYRS